ncbi:hypothetical protein AKO1_003035 [Acrasis kona]|uniref:Uncharacterized protein n=1 Tax=Acrasis kona TaxID=1008807 RepID=A0AAW2ZMF1_9EUKA
MKRVVRKKNIQTLDEFERAIPKKNTIVHKFNQFADWKSFLKKHWGAIPNISSFYEFKVTKEGVFYKEFCTDAEWDHFVNTHHTPCEQLNCDVLPPNGITPAQQKGLRKIWDLIEDENKNEFLPFMSNAE